MSLNSFEPKCLTYLLTPETSCSGSRHPCAASPVWGVIKAVLWIALTVAAIILAGAAAG